MPEYGYRVTIQVEERDPGESLPIVGHGADLTFTYVGDIEAGTCAKAVCNAASKVSARAEEELAQ